MKISHVSLAQTKTYSPFLKKRNESFELKEDFSFSKNYSNAIKAYSNVSFEGKNRNTPNALFYGVSKALKQQDEQKAASMLATFYNNQGGFEEIREDSNFQKKGMIVDFSDYSYGFKKEELKEILVKEGAIAYRNGDDLFEVEVYGKKDYEFSHKKEPVYLVNDLANRIKHKFDTEIEIDGCIDETAKFYQENDKDSGLRKMTRKYAQRFKPKKGYNYENVLNVEVGRVLIGKQSLGFDFDGSRLDIEFDKKGNPVYTRVANHNKFAFKVLAQ